MALPLLAGLAGLGRVGAGIAARQAGKKGLQQTIANASRAAANPVAKPTAREGALGALGAAGAGMGAVATGAAMDRGDYGSALVNGVGTMLGGANMAGNVARTAVGASRLAAGTTTGATGLFNSTPLADSAARGIANIMRPAEAAPVQNPVVTNTPATTATAAQPQVEQRQATQQGDAEAARRAQALAVQDAERTGAINRFGVRAGENYQEITDDLRKMADQGPRQWETSLRDMSEWEADTRRREIRMAYANHPIPGKGEGKVLDFDRDLQKRREAIENSRINGYGQNVSAFDKSLAALGQANGQSVDMADKMFGQTAMRRGQDITAQKNLWDAQASDKSATAQLLTALGGLGGGKGGKGESPYKSEKERLDYLKSLAETQYPDNPQGQKKLIDSVLLNSENGKAWDTLMQDGMPNVANELLTSMTDQTTYTPEQLGGATRSRFNLLDQLKGQWDDLGDSERDNTTWFEPRYTIPGRSDSVNERTLANLKNQSVTDLVKQAVLNPTQQVNGMPFTYADFNGDEAAFQRAVMSHFQAAHSTANHEKGR